MTKIDCLIPANKISMQIMRLGSEISRFYDGLPLTIISVLSGSFMFVADLIREFSGSNIQVGFMGVESYDGIERKDLRITSELSLDVTGRNVLLVDDILDSGKTLGFVKAHVLNCGANSV